MEVSICICDGRYSGCSHGKTCTRIAGGQWSLHYCPDCDDNRMLHLDLALDKMMENPTKRYGR